MKVRAVPAGGRICRQGWIERKSRHHVWRILQQNGCAESGFDIRPHCWARLSVPGSKADWLSPAPPPPEKGGFREAAAEAGISFRMSYLTDEGPKKTKPNLYPHGCGVAVGDFDGDGFDDIYFLNQIGPNALYRNKGDGTFEDVTEKTGVGVGDRICVGATFADYDNSGRQSLFVTSTRGGNVLFRNMGNGTFKEVTKEAGLSSDGWSFAGRRFFRLRQ